MCSGFFSESVCVYIYMYINIYIYTYIYIVFMGRAGGKRIHKNQSQGKL